jgi:putrescine aminotransferase
MARDACIANGLMVRGIRDSLVMCPPLIITTQQIDELIAIIRKSLDEVEPRLRAIG